MSWRGYTNGNGRILINSKTGTRVIWTEGNEEFCPDFPISMDLNCSNKCDIGCPYCYQGCTPDGKHADLMSAKFIDTIPPHVEVALQIPLDHPQLMPFLKKLKERKLIPSITFNQITFEKNTDVIKSLLDEKLIYGVGISLVSSTDEFIEKVKQFPTAVIHVINGVFNKEDCEKLSGHNLKLLILGYKNKGRGVSYKNNFYGVIKDAMRWLYEDIIKISDGFKVISFDNLAIEQLDMKRYFTDAEWEQFYQGDEGSLSMYVDLVDKTFGVSSLIPKTEMKPMLDDIRDMFVEVRRKVA